MKKLILTLVSVVLLFSCKNEEISALKSLNTLEGKWTIEQVDLSKLSKDIKLSKISGTIDLIYCKAKLAAIESPNYVCTGAATLNGKSFFLSYRFDDNTKVLKLFITPQEIGTEEEQNIALVMSGDWKVDNSSGSTLTAVRQSSAKVSAISFSAKK